MSKSNSREKRKSGRSGESNGAASPLHDYIRLPQVKRILTQLVSAQDEYGFRSVVVLSEFEGEGRTFFVSALALSYALMLNRRVLILETIEQTVNRTLFGGRVWGDEERGTDGIFSQERSKLSLELKTAERSVKAQKLLDGPGAIDVVSTTNLETGVSDLTDFQLGSDIAALSEGYDLLLIDTCALSAADRNNVDPVIIAKHSDTALLVTSWASLNKEVLARVKADLMRWQVPLLGTIFNSGAPR